MTFFTVQYLFCTKEFEEYMQQRHVQLYKNVYNVPAAYNSVTMHVRLYVYISPEIVLKEIQIGFSLPKGIGPHGVFPIFNVVVCLLYNKRIASKLHTLSILTLCRVFEKNKTHFTSRFDYKCFYKDVWMI